MHPPLYETDFYTWAIQQSQLLRDRQLQQVDWDNIIEEIEALGRSQYHALVSGIEQLTLHLLKWQFQSKRRSKSWKHSINKQRIQIERLLEDNPGLAAKLDEIIPKGYKYARKGAIQETGLPSTTFPEFCPYSWNDLTDEHFFPEPANE